MMRVAVLGAGGQIGSHLVARLQREGDVQAWGICRNEVTAAPLRLQGLEVRLGSVTDLAGRGQLLGDADLVINCTAAGGMPAQARIANEALLAAILAAPGNRRIVHFSSVAVYGSCIAAVRNTFARPRPDSVYGIDKLRLERDLRRRAGRHSVVVLRMGHVYGAGQWLSRFVLGALHDPARLLPFDGRLPANAVHVRNVASAIVRLIMDWQPGTYNVFDQPNAAWREVFDWHSQALGMPALLAMDEGTSARYCVLHRRRARQGLSGRALVAGGQWLRGSRGGLLSQPEVKQFGISLLARYRMLGLERRMLLRATRSGTPPPATVMPEPYLFCEGAPGPQLQYTAERNEADARAVAAWYRRYSDPECLLDWEKATAGIAAFA